jgi:hypothetical protein
MKPLWIDSNFPNAKKVQLSLLEEKYDAPHTALDEIKEFWTLVDDDIYIKL